MAKKVIKSVLIVLALLCFGIVLWLGPLVRDIFKSGILDKNEVRTYDGNNAENLKMMYAAILAYHNSEDHFPDASGWMDAIQNRIKTADLSEGDAKKKMIRPDLRDKPGQFGYAMNDAASKKYKGDIKDQKIPLLFISLSTARNAHGNPRIDAQPGHILAVSVDGTIIKLP